jgi:hypothetical protein
VVVGTDGDPHVARLPASWRTDGDAYARRILATAQRTMRALGTLRQVETVQSAAGRGPKARTEFRFHAPDRMAYRTASAASIIIGKRSWIHTDQTFGWQALPADGEPFRVRDGFRWTIFSSAARLLGLRREGGRPVAEIALLDWGYPVWYRVTVDRRSKLVLRQSLISPENRIDDRYFAFDRPLRIEPPPMDR